MDVKQRNKDVKTALIKAFPEALKVSVTGGTGTAYGWCNARIEVPKLAGCFCSPDLIGKCSYCRNQWDIERKKVNEATKNIEFYHYGDDMGGEHREFLYNVCYIEPKGAI